MADFTLQKALDEYVSIDGSNDEIQLPENGHKLTPELAGYKHPGSHPWICTNCSHMDNDMNCAVVEGPNGGRVRPEDSCKLWTPDTAMVGGRGQPEVRDENEEPGPPRMV